jgi:ABC-type multidrug transport system fused ATPase/permease subunit
MVIHKGEKIAVTGNSGEGKTTFLLLLLRLLRETQGEIRMDGLPIRADISWRQHLGYVPQNPFILDATVAENIAFGIQAAAIDRNKIIRLLSDLDLEKTVGHLPQGMDTAIGEHGVKLSGGQRQRLAIARVLYADADVLLLDEITNQVHPFLEQEIFGVLNNLSGTGKTIIMVTHKLTHPDFFDSVYRLEHGNFSAIRQRP